jgi:hypothetical protein
MRGGVIMVSRYARDFWSSPPASPLGRCWTSFVHRAHRSAGSTAIGQVVRLPDSPIDVPRAHCVGLNVVAKLGGRSQSAVVEPFLPRMASRLDLLTGPDLNWTRSGVGAAPAGALCYLRGIDGVDLRKLSVKPVHLDGGGRR